MLHLARIGIAPVATILHSGSIGTTLLGGSFPIPVLFTLSLVPHPYLVLFFHQFLILSPYLEQIDSQARMHGLSHHQAMATTSKVLASNIISQWVFPT